MSEKQLLTVKETAARLRLHPNAVYRRIERGELPAVALGTGPRAPLRVSEAELEQWLYAYPLVERSE